MITEQESILLDLINSVEVAIKIFNRKGYSS